MMQWRSFVEITKIFQIHDTFSLEQNHLIKFKRLLSKTRLQTGSCRASILSCSGPSSLELNISWDVSGAADEKLFYTTMETD